MMPTARDVPFRMVTEFGGGAVTADPPQSTVSQSVAFAVVYRNSAPEDPSGAQWMRLQEQSGSFDFWLHPDEDVYSETDGEPA